MKRIMIGIFMMMLFLGGNVVNAANEYDFEITYTQDVIVNEIKEANVLLKGDNATAYTNAMILMQVTGPASPDIISYDSSGQKINVTQAGYLVSNTGIAVGGTFTNTIPVQFKFPKAGSYHIKLELVDAINASTQITSKDFTIQVLEVEKQSTINKPPVQEEEKTEITQLPKTGFSILDFIMYMMIGTAIVYVMYVITTKRKEENEVGKK